MTNGTRRICSTKLGIAACIAALLFPVSASGGHGDYDYPTHYETWHINDNIPSGWHQALINGALVWDNVPYQCHDFRRVGTPNGQIPHWRHTLDGPGGATLFAINTNHTNIRYDSEEPWHTNINMATPAGKVDLWSMAAHENGHNLFLNHSYPLTNTMGEYYFYGEDYWRDLTQEDRTEIQAIYPTPSCG